MTSVRKLALLVAVAYPALCAGRPMPLQPGMVRITSGTFAPLYAPAGQRTVKIAAFAIDVLPVSEDAFARFAARHPEWRLPLRTWSASRPMTNVTWKAATAYCKARGARLPTTNEWEYVARADESNRNAAGTSAFKQRALEFAVRARTGVFTLGGGLRNVWGVQDMHGGIAEWTIDFNGSAHAHNRGQHTANMTCATGVVETGDASDYAAFMRYSLRRSLTVESANANLGFRCAV